MPVSTSNLPLPGMDPEKLLVLASGIETHRLESGGASREMGDYERGLTTLSLVEDREDSP